MLAPKNLGPSGLLPGGEKCFCATSTAQRRRERGVGPVEKGELRGENEYQPSTGHILWIEYHVVPKVDDAMVCFFDFAVIIAKPHSSGKRCEGTCLGDGMNAEDGRNCVDKGRVVPLGSRRREYVQTASHGQFRAGP